MPVVFAHCLGESRWSWPQCTSLPFCPPHLQVFQSLVYDTQVREAVGPARSKVGWDFFMLVIVVKSYTFLLIRWDGLKGSETLLVQISVLIALESFSGVRFV